MRCSRLAWGLCALPVLVLTVLAADPAPKAESPLKFKKIDVVNGELWYEAPDWTPHRFRAGKDDYTEGDKNVYSHSFCVWCEDLNGDGWPDIIVVDFPGAPMAWYENPQGKEGLWKKHEIWHSACN